jgi:hypothetical protein
VKADKTVPLRFAVVITVLLGYRMVAYYVKKQKDAVLARAQAAKKPATARVTGSSLGDTGGSTSAEN